MKQKFIDAVHEHNLTKVRMMLADELLLDPRGASFSEMLEYAKTNMEDLFEPNKKSDYIISDDRNTWNMEFLSKVKQDLITNFSVEKLVFFQEMAMEVGKDKAKALTEEENWDRIHSSRTSHLNGSSYDNESSYGSDVNEHRDIHGNRWDDMPNNRTLGTISLCGGAAMTIVGICVKGSVAQTLLCLAGGAAVVGGIVLLTKNNKK